MQNLIFLVLLTQGMVASSSWAIGQREMEEYVGMAAEEKQQYQRQQALRSRRLGVPSTAWQVCVGAVAGAAMGLRSYVAPILNTNTANPGGLLRRLTGKPIHRYGVTASGVIGLNAGTGLLAERAVPVTVRFSLAGPYLPRVEAIVDSGIGNYHPGFLISFHLDNYPDQNLVLMPRKGLDGYRKHVNPLREVYTHRIDFPEKWGMRLLAESTFARFVTDPSSQDLTPFARRLATGERVDVPLRVPHQLYFSAPNSLADRFEEVALRGVESPEARARMESPYDDRIVLAMLDSRTPYTLFRISNGQIDVGSLQITSSFELSSHGDAWYTPHPGFDEK